MATSLAPWRFTAGRMLSSSSDSPELDKAKYIFSLDHPQITVTGLAGMDKVCRGACAGEGGSNFSGDMPGFAHATDNYTACTGKNQGHSVGKVTVERGIRASRAWLQSAVVAFAVRWHALQVLPWSGNFGGWSEKGLGPWGFSVYDCHNYITQGALAFLFPCYGYLTAYSGSSRCFSACRRVVSSDQSTPGSRLPVGWEYYWSSCVQSDEGREGGGALAEFGVVFLMFSIGLEFSLPKLYTMKRTVFGLGLAQVGFTMLLVTGW